MKHSAAEMLLRQMKPRGCQQVVKQRAEMQSSAAELLDLSLSTDPRPPAGSVCIYQRALSAPR